jgi:hypothetical protein
MDGAGAAEAVATADRRRSAAREAPVVSGVAWAGVAGVRVDRRVGTGSTMGASKGNAAGSFRVVSLGAATVVITGSDHLVKRLLTKVTIR